MNAILSKLLLSGDKFMLVMHWKHHGFTYIASGGFIKERIKKCKGAWDSRYIYQNELD